MRLITLAIHTYDRALALKTLLESEGIAVTLQNVNLEQPEISPGVRVRIDLNDLALALRIVENPQVFSGDPVQTATKCNRQSILVPVDFSELSLISAEVALRMAAKRNTEVVFLHTYIDPGLSGSVQLSDNLTYDLSDAAVGEHLVASANGSMARFASKIRQLMKDCKLPMVHFSTAVVEGVPEDAIVSFTKENAPYLVIMGTRSSHRKETEFIGSVTAEVLDAGQFTVLTVPEPTMPNSVENPSNILFFGNVDQHDIIAMDMLYRYFPESKANVTIVNMAERHIFGDRHSGKMATALKEYCERTFGNFKFMSATISPANALKELSALHNDCKFDLIVLPNKRKNALSRLFNPGLAHSILFQSDIPMLAIPI